MKNVMKTATAGIAINTNGISLFFLKFVLILPLLNILISVPDGARF